MDGEDVREYPEKIMFGVDPFESGKDVRVIVHKVVFHADPYERGDIVARLDVSFVRDEGTFQERGYVGMLLRDWLKIDRFATEVTLPAGTWWRA